jgi:glycosyltransferase involved in cell wall biosynthesis
VRVLHTEWSDGWGGQEIRIITEMEGVREKGVDVRLACRENSKIKEEALKRDFKVYVLPFKGNTDFSTLFKLRKIIKQDGIDIVNTHSGKDTWVGGFAAKLAGAKFIRTRHLSNRISSSRLNFINELADFIITTGEKVKNDMIRYNRIRSEKIESVPTGVDEEIFNPENYDKEKLREKFGFKKRVVIGNLGVLRNVKGQIYLVEAAKILANKYSDLEFTIAGEGPKREFLEKEIEKLGNFRLLGHQDAAEFLAAIDIFVLSSLNEGVPQSLMQALAMNVPSVATDVGSVRDLYNDNFLLIKPKSAEEIADAIESLLKNRNMFSDTREFIVKNFSKKVMIDKILRIYEKVLQ